MGVTNTQTLNRLFDALSSAQRRRILVALLDHNPQTVAEIGAKRETVTESEEGSLRDYHVHLPKLEAYEFVEWDRDENEVVKGPKFEEVRPLLERLHERQEEFSAGRT